MEGFCPKSLFWGGLCGGTSNGLSMGSTSVNEPLRSCLGTPPHLGGESKTPAEVWGGSGPHPGGATAGQGLGKRGLRPPPTPPCWDPGPKHPGSQSLASQRCVEAASHREIGNSSVRGWPWGPRAGKAPLEGVILGRATGGGNRVTKAAPISPGGVRGDELLGAFVTGPVSFCFLPWLVHVRSCVARRAPWAKSIGVPQKGLLRLSSPSLTPVLEAAVPACVERSPFSFQPLLSSPGTGLGFPSGLHFAAGWSRSGLWGLLGRAQDPASIPRLLWRWVPAPGPAPHLFPLPLLVHTARKGKGTRQGKGRECSGAAALPPPAF